ncbi:hypothetical protein [Wolbachia endosymbiont of Aedes albopictus]|nr:hypothetical protein [Wolbachia endosymbiont of Aedes albopictus]UVW83489.1 hypothetical protein NHG98_03835 [Wolbachia endosymbiont of Aedes albopictus]
MLAGSMLGDTANESRYDGSRQMTACDQKKHRPQVSATFMTPL